LEGGTGIGIATMAASVGRGKIDDKLCFTQAEISSLDARIRRIVAPKPVPDPRWRKFLARKIGCA
jgi:hypothetical protein